jgi:hypothetical protein
VSRRADHSLRRGCSLVSVMIASPKVIKPTGLSVEITRRHYRLLSGELTFPVREINSS